MFTLALVGRPNVGKSTLFNRLAGKKLAIVDDTPGITRDWRSAEGWLFDAQMRIIDTAGLEESFDESIQGRMRQQTEQALTHADAVVFIIDGRAGLTPLDEHFAQWLRKQKKSVILAVNKGENERAIAACLGEAYSLGLGEPIAISAEHGTGMEELYHAIAPLLPAEEEDSEQENEEKENLDDTIDDLEGQENYEFQQDDIDPDKPLKIAIVGRPNVGKSTLLNAIVKEHRVMTGPEAGITRDAVSVDWNYEERKFRLVDTAGMRRRAKVTDNIEKMSVDDALRAIRLAQIVILVIDANQILDKQDLQIAEHIINEGRALILAVNKWDSIKNRDEKLEELAYKCETSLAQLKDIPYQTISALNGKNITKLLDRALNVYEVWNKRIKTAGLNRWLAKMESQNPAPLISGRSNRLKYITQIKTRPPTFALWVSRPDKLPDSHKRFIINGLRRDYDIPGVPVRLLVRKSKNPFTD
ncbi:MAG: ribosome biogenesis GTPase Der [Alphaproteobacteria bacterium]|nr:ribosome biogenesis GTPase Der [Alphaproteobacteria bacterium]